MVQDALNIFGPNVATVRLINALLQNFAYRNLQAEGTEWQRQRKLTASPFNEQKSRLVWEEAIHQASDMLESWLACEKAGSKSTSEDTRTLALHVLAYVGFQNSYSFKSVVKDTNVQQPSTYRDSLAIVLKNILVIIVLPGLAFRIPFLPAKWRNIGLAVITFRKYMLDQLAHEKRLIAEGKPGSGTLMSNLVRASEARQDTMGGEEKEKTWEEGRLHEMKPLSVDEILGNIFLFNFAGHDTTAISLAFSVLLLVAHPELQDWISEELHFYLETDQKEAWKYELVFPKLKRCLSILVRVHCAVQPHFDSF